TSQPPGAESSGVDTDAEGTAAHLDHLTRRIRECDVEEHADEVERVQAGNDQRHKEEHGAANRVQPRALEGPEAGGQGEAPGRDHGKPEQVEVPADDVETGAHQSYAVADARCHAD